MKHFTGSDCISPASFHICGNKSLEDWNEKTLNTSEFMIESNTHAEHGLTDLTLQRTDNFFDDNNENNSSSILVRTYTIRGNESIVNYGYLICELPYPTRIECNSINPQIRNQIDIQFLDSHAGRPGEMTITKRNLITGMVEFTEIFEKEMLMKEDSSGTTGNELPGRGVPGPGFLGFAITRTRPGPGFQYPEGTRNLKGRKFPQNIALFE